MSGVSFKTSTLLLDRLLFKHKRTTARQVVLALDILCDIQIGKSVELAGDVVHLLPQLLNERRVCVSGCSLVFRDELLKLLLPYRRHSVVGKLAIQLLNQRLLADIGLRTAAFLFGAAIVGMAFLYLGGDHTAALAATQKATESLWLVRCFHRMSALDNDFLHFVEKALFDNRRMSSFVHLAAVGKETDIKWIGKNEPNPVFVCLVTEMTFNSVLFQKYRNVFKTRIAFSVQFKGRANYF